MQAKHFLYARFFYNRQDSTENLLPVSDSLDEFVAMTMLMGDITVHDEKSATLD